MYPLDITCSSWPVRQDRTVLSQSMPLLRRSLASPRNDPPMRVANLLPTLLLPALLLAQATPRFIEVQVSDSVRLPFEGMDLEVRMDDPVQLAMNNASALGDADIDYEKIIDKSAAEAKTYEDRFLSLVKSNGFTYRLSSTEHTQDYSGNSNKTFEVNTYLLQLKAADMERYYKMADGHNGWSGSPKEAHYGDASSASPRLMRKLHEQAKREAEALVAVTGGRLGKVISVQEIPRNEGSVLEQLFKLEKGGDKDDVLMQLGSSSQTTMAFRFELLD